MTTHLKIMTVFEDGHVETLDHDWPGWNFDAAASVMRAQRHAAGGGRVYDLPLDERHRDARIVRVTHEWSTGDSDEDCASRAAS